MKPPWMSRADRRRWRTARRLEGLGDLVALWLTRDIESLPGYQPRYGPDEETTLLIPTLAACNRAGYVTISSQPGTSDIGYDGALWEQRAAVEGFVTDPNLTAALVQAAHDVGLKAIVHGPDSKPGRGGLAVTTRDGEPHTWFGAALNRRNIAGIWNGCHPDAVAEACQAQQLTLIDPLYGPSSRLWKALDNATAQLTRADSSPRHSGRRAGDT